MGRHSRVSDALRVELWRRYRAGKTVHGIAKALGQRSSSNIYRVLGRTANRICSACPTIVASRSVAERAKAGDQSLKAAPVHAPRRRLDETLAARKPVLVYQKAPQAAAAE
jgi:hypothetical protein